MSVLCSCAFPWSTATQHRTWQTCAPGAQSLGKIGAVPDMQQRFSSQVALNLCLLSTNAGCRSHEYLSWMLRYENNHPVALHFGCLNRAGLFATALLVKYCSPWRP